MKKLIFALFVSFFSFPTLAIAPFSVTYGYEWNGVNYQFLQEYKNDNTVTEKWKGDDGSSYLDELKNSFPPTWTWHYDGSDSNGERFIYSEFKINTDNGWTKMSVYADYIYDFDNNIVTIVERKEGGQIFKEKIISHSFGESSTTSDSNFIKTDERQKLNSCSDISNNQIDSSLKGYGDIFFGMTEDEFKLLASCKNGSIMNLASNQLGKGLLSEGIYKYPVNPIFTGRGVTEIIVRAYLEYHNRKNINSNNSGISGVDEIKNALGKKYDLLFKPSDKSIEKYNEFLSWSEVDFVFQNKDTQNLVLLRVSYVPQGDKYLYSGYVHYLSEQASNTYLKIRKSEGVSEDDF